MGDLERAPLGASVRSTCCHGHLSASVARLASRCLLATDCGASSIHDLGLVATEKDGRKGLCGVDGGGVRGRRPVHRGRARRLRHRGRAAGRARGAGPAPPALFEPQEPQRRTHQVSWSIASAMRSSATCSPRNSRAPRRCPIRPWQPQTWRQPTDAPEPKSPGGVVSQHNGHLSVVRNLPLRLLSADQLDGLAGASPSAVAAEPPAHDARTEHRVPLASTPNWSATSLTRCAASACRSLTTSATWPTWSPARARRASASASPIRRTSAR